MKDREQLVREAEALAEWIENSAAMERAVNSISWRQEQAAIIRLLLSLLPKEGEVVSDEMLNFLHGIGPLNGVHFGEKPKGERGQYWWRKQLPNARPK